jgi:uncharacterized protein YceK
MKKIHILSLSLVFLFSLTLSGCSSPKTTTTTTEETSVRPVTGSTTTTETVKTY